jgi:flagellar biosynthesis protein FlhG
LAVAAHDLPLAEVRRFPLARAAARVLEARPEPLPDGPQIWAVAGGKGGVGKSVVTSSLAAAIAGSGRRCAVIDADLGGANLHTLLGVSRPRRTLSHLLSCEVDSLAELMVQTSVRNLFLVSGDEALLEIANPTHGQKEKLFRHIRGLDVDDVLLDVGAGSAFNVLDFFLLAQRQLVVVTPEPTSIENAEHFLRAALYRSLRGVAKQPEVKAAILRARELHHGPPVRAAAELIERVRAVDPPAAKLLDECAQAFRPLLLVNQARTLEHRELGPQLASACRERLGVEIRFAGALDADPNVTAAVARRQPVFQVFPRCEFSRRIDALAERLLRGDCDAARAPAARPAPARPLPPLDPAAPGAWLRRCREALGLSLRDLTERTRIRVLDAIERERFDALPPEPYLRGYLLSYAQELGVADVAGLVACYLARLPRA